MDAEAVLEVRKANELFYRALDALDLRAMERAWSHGSLVRCVHPGWELIVGWDAVRASWEGIFRNTRAHSVEPGDVVIHTVGDLSWVSCIERITVAGAGGGTSFAAATNLFQRFDNGGEGWLMILHHASLLPVSIPDALETPGVVH